MSQDNQSKSTDEQITESPQKPYQRVQPFWKAKIIQLLQGTIGVLEVTVEKLETAPPPGTEEKPGFLQQLQLRWGGLLRTIRLFLPSNLSTKLSDTALTGIVTGIAVIILWTTTTVFTGKPTEIATVPPIEEVPVPTPTITTPPESVAPEPQPPQPLEEITPPPEPEPEPTLEPKPEPIPTPTPTPVIELTPEQALIAAIENQVAETSDRIASGLIKSIQANFRTSNLTVKISDDWYSLKESQQDNLAAEILQRSQELDFTHLEIIDSQNKLIARNPVVGTEMVIFKRQTTS
jgi:cell division septation protein DedD